MITKEEAYEQADRYLIENIGNLIGPGEPIFDSKVGIWIVPVFHMSKVAVFPIGEMVIDSDGNILYAPTGKDIEEMFERKLASNEKLKEKFQLVATG
ncbi:MAG: hypothetical protein HYW24_00385 [Candidatus Aenigmarchaeota archaeon]|nr:hypothetical protein [Candidatus Aenigmarchaeota archaeon]